jgi:hypothetical protein
MSEPSVEPLVVGRNREPERITVEEVKGRIDRGESVVFLDTRAPDAWEKSDIKIKGAIRVPQKRPTSISVRSLPAT